MAYIANGNQKRVDMDSLVAYLNREKTGNKSIATNCYEREKTYDYPSPKESKSERVGSRLIWTEDRINTLKYELTHGATCEELANLYGVSKQRINQLVGGEVGKMRKWNKQYSMYPVIDSWMKYNHITFAQLSCDFGYSPSANSWNNMRKLLFGEAELKKWQIDKLLSMIGLPYEEVFSFEVNENA